MSSSVDVRPILPLPMYRMVWLAFKASGADFIVALGGGSSIDTAKGIGIVVNNPDFADVKSLEGVAATRHKAVPTFALPTTAGTAAEVTINYVIIDEDVKRRWSA